MKKLNEPKTPLKVLVVDDDPGIIKSLSAILEKTGNEIRTASNGKQALQIATEYKPEVMFLDLSLPEIDGFEVAERIREEEWARDTTIIALTGWGQERDKVRSRKVGFDLHLVKPVETKTLIELLTFLKRT